LCVFYLYDPLRDELEAKHALGDATSVVKGLRIGVGQRLSGWVAANRQTIINSDPTLDLGEVARFVEPRLRSCLSTPLISDDTLVGVLTLYSATLDGFTEDHQRIIEVVARQISHTFKGAAEFDSSAKRDSITGLPGVIQLEHLANSGGLEDSGRTALVFIDIVDLKRINTLHGRSAGDDVLRHVARHARTGLRVADILFRSAGDEFVALLNDSDPSAAIAAAVRIEEAIHDTPVSLKTGALLGVEVKVTSVCPPRGVKSLSDLMAAAKARTHKSRPDTNPSIH